jgi:HAD superfamily hydrolase (TIGR01509 family)
MLWRPGRRDDMGPVAIAAIVFDFDGLLMDTERCLLSSWQYEWRQHGLELDLDRYWVNHGGEVDTERYRRLADAVGPSYDQAASHVRREAYRMRLLRDLGLSPGIGAWLRQARRARLRLAIASSSSEAWVRGMLRRVGRENEFAVFACGDEVHRAKPDPCVYQLALDRLGLPPSRAVAVEDSAHGVAAAKAAGLRCIAIPNIHVGSDRLCSADLVLTSAADVSLAQALRKLPPPALQTR